MEATASIYERFAFEARARERKIFFKDYKAIPACSSEMALFVSGSLWFINKRTANGVN